MHDLTRSRPESSAGLAVAAVPALPAGRVPAVATVLAWPQCRPCPQCRRCCGATGYHPHLILRASQVRNRSLHQ